MSDPRGARPLGWSDLDWARWWILQPECGETSRAHIEALATRTEDLENALRAMRHLAGVSTEGDPWYAEHEGVDAAAIFAQARKVLGENENGD